MSHALPSAPVVPTILLVDAAVCQATVLAVLAIGWMIDVAATTTIASRYLLRRSYNVIVIDIAMHSALDLIRAIRFDNEALREMLVIISTEDSSVKSRTLAHVLNCPDYLTKPYEPRVLLDVVGSALARRQIPDQVEVGHLVIRAEDAVFGMGGVAIALTRQQRAILDVLAMRKNRTVRTETIFHELRVKYPGLTRGGLGTQIRLMRFRFKKACGGADYLHTAYGIGYALRDPIGRADLIGQADPPPGHADPIDNHHDDQEDVANDEETIRLSHHEL